VERVDVKKQTEPFGYACFQVSDVALRAGVARPGRRLSFSK